MGIGKLIEEAAGAIAAEEAVEKFDPNAGFLVKAGAAIAGFVGAGKLADMLDAPAADQQPKDDNSPFEPA